MSLPDKVYKYRNWTNDFHKNVLLRNQLYMSSPEDFNDPFDCRITKNHHLLDSPEKIESYINNSLNEHKDYMEDQGLDFDEEKEKLLKRLQNIDKYQDEYEELEFQNVDDYIGVLSLSARWDSILMWSHYGDFHKGYCIGFDEQILRESQLFGKGGNVAYQDDFPKLDPNDKDLDIMAMSFYQTHHKAKDWEYEEEYRLTNFFYPIEKEEQYRVVEFPEEAIKEIVLGLNINSAHREEILESCAKREIPVFQTKKIRYEFKLDRERLI